MPRLRQLLCHGGQRLLLYDHITLQGSLLARTHLLLPPGHLALCVQLCGHALLLQLQVLHLH